MANLQIKDSLRNGGYYFALNDYVDLAIRRYIYKKAGNQQLNQTIKNDIYIAEV